MATINDDNTRSNNINGIDEIYNHQKQRIDTYYGLNYSNANHSNQEKLSKMNDIAHHLYSNGLDAEKNMQYDIYFEGAFYAPLPPPHNDGCTQVKSEDGRMDILSKAASKSEEIANYIYTLQNPINDPEHLKNAWEELRLFQVKNDVRLNERDMMTTPLLQTEADIRNDLDRMLTYEVNYKKHADLSLHEMMVKVGKVCFIGYNYQCAVCELAGNKYNACPNKDTCKYYFDRITADWQNQMNILRRFKVDRKGKMEGLYYIGTLIKMTMRVYRMIKMIEAKKGNKCCCQNMDQCTNPYAH